MGRVVRPSSVVTGNEPVFQASPILLSVNKDASDAVSSESRTGQKSWWLESPALKEWTWPATLTLNANDVAVADVVGMELGISETGRWEFKYYIDVFLPAGFTKLRIWWDLNAYDAKDNRLFYIHVDERTFFGRTAVGCVSLGQDLSIQKYFNIIERWSRPVNGFLEK